MVVSKANVVSRRQDVLVLTQLNMGNSFGWSNCQEFPTVEQADLWVEDMARRFPDREYRVVTKTKIIEVEVVTVLRDGRAVAP
jgi:hypothetical protein